MHFMVLTAAIAALWAASAPAVSPAEIAKAAPARDWVAIAPRDIMVMDLAPDSAGTARRVVIQLMPPPFAPHHIANIRALAAARWWDGTSINRVQDNYVVQWGDPTEKKPLPPGLTTAPAADYAIAADALKGWSGAATPPLRDAYAARVGFRAGWPLASDGREIWPVHCYGMVGVGRNLSPDTGSGAELYAVIGHAPRHLDRNVALVGRVVAGMEHLSALPRGSGALGFYQQAAEHTPIVAVRMGDTLPPGEQPHFQYLSTESAAFTFYVKARANRSDGFFIRPAGAVDVCNALPPVRAAR
ncbi:peptidylprolyl isomerase [uncultured Sphingomonas sp.]|uniref:peptidylprolyl isomerase n=1 Tax=uncultured Sphingomonas sp. TaxID=158754 RepID=UPI0025DB9611|nr:peptidylprolyl isomerase [uncultured Sphingomonas sp.]